MANILVTGGAGYIGSVCSAKLINQGHSVAIIDDLSTGFAEAVPAAATLHRIDIGDQHRVRALLSHLPVDVVFHFAAKALVPESVSNPGIFFDANVASGITFLEEVRRAGVRKFVFSSSAAVYGQPECMPIDEDHPKNPLNSYGETKLMFERILAWYASAYGWGTAALRYFNACGAAGDHGERHDPETHIIPLLLQAASNQRKPFNIFGDDFPTPDGTCLRDYVHVLDIADAHIRTLPLLEEAGMNVFNIGTGDSRSVKQMISAVVAVTGEAVPVSIAPRRPGDPATLCASPEKIMRVLGWKPRYSDLTNIVQTAWDFYKRAPALTI
jgi:UDP-glucose 4-epimerase